MICGKTNSAVASVTVTSDSISCSFIKIGCFWMLIDDYSWSKSTWSKINLYIGSLWFFTIIVNIGKCGYQGLRILGKLGKCKLKCPDHNHNTISFFPFFFSFVFYIHEVVPNFEKFELPVIDVIFLCCLSRVVYIPVHALTISWLNYKQAVIW